MNELTVPATIENMEKIQTFIEAELEQHDCSTLAMLQLSAAVEEIYINIVQYACNLQIEAATVRCSVGEEPLQVTIQFLECGKPFHPSSRENARNTFSSEEGHIGDPGILMVKKSMDQVDYDYKNSKHILTIHKNCDELQMRAIRR